MAIAEQWLEVIDRPLKEHGSGAGINRKAVRRMKKAAVDALQDANPRGGNILVFKDGSGLWEKRKDEWFPADEERIAELQKENE